MRFEVLTLCPRRRRPRAPGGWREKGESRLDVIAALVPPGATTKRSPVSSPGVRAALLRAAAAAKIHDMCEERGAPAAAGGGAPGEQSSRYTSSLLSLLLQQYGKRGRPPPALCPCVPQPGR
ncbi:unnamed protein product, partial [Prorocentrum cordatum]